MNTRHFLKQFIFGALALSISGPLIYGSTSIVTTPKFSDVAKLALKNGKCIVVTLGPNNRSNVISVVLCRRYEAFEYIIKHFVSIVGDEKEEKLDLENKIKFLLSNTKRKVTIEIIDDIESYIDRNKLELASSSSLFEVFWEKGWENKL